MKGRIAKILSVAMVFAIVLSMSVFSVPVYAEHDPALDWIANGPGSIEEWIIDSLVNIYSYFDARDGSSGSSLGDVLVTPGSVEAQKLTQPRTWYTNTNVSVADAGISGGGFSGSRPFVDLSGGGYSGSRNGTVTANQSGNTAKTSLVNTTYNTTTNNYESTFNYITNTFNQTTNNYYETYNIKNIYYNNTYNTYNIQTTNNYNYYITYSPTFINITYLDSATQTTVSDLHFYKLPDGRNSWDLTADEVFGMYFIYNATNYDMVVEDPGTVSLLHFDGDMEDSGVYGNDAVWVEGASVAYTNSDAFNAGLYMDATKHVMRIPVGGELGGDWTCEFRIYMMGNTATYGGACFSFLGMWQGGVHTPILKVSRPVGAYGNLYLGGPNIGYRTGTTELTAVPSGQWSTIAVVSRGGVAEVYFNGLKTSISVSGVNLSGKDLCLSWFTYDVSKDSYGVLLEYINNGFILDELRVTNEALYTGSYYNPISHPFDTNKVLVLPESGSDGEIAIKSNLVVGDMRVGGVRPTYPVAGDVFIAIEKTETAHTVTSAQQYQSGGWVAVDAAIRENGEWVHLKNYDLKSYTVDPGDYPGQGGDDGGDDSSQPLDPDNPGDPTEPGFWEKIGDAIWGLISGLLSLIAKLVTGIVSVITGLFDALFNLLGFTTRFGEFMASALGFLPPEITGLIVVGLSLAIILMIINFFR